MRRLVAVTFAFAALIACKPNTAVNGDSGTEVSCSSDSDCSAALDAGNCSSDGFCVLCGTNTPCPTGEICNAGTCEISSGSGGSTGGSTTGGSAGGSSTGGITPGQCNSSCDCKADGGSAIKGPACVSGVCAPLPKLPDGGPTCARTNDCVCGDFCSAGTCQPQCTQNSDCPPADPFCYLPQGQCGPCTNSQECPTGESCVGGKCSTATGDGGCSASHCCSSGDCLASLPVCNNGVCSKCTTSVECSAGYVCNTTSGACVVSGDGGGGCGPNGCTGNLVCSTGACVASSCNPPCGPPATCGANNNCTCPANCGGICASGQTCNTSTCQCGAGSGGTIGGASGGFPSGGLIGGASGGFNTDAGPTCTLSGCGGCPSGTNCYCFDVSSLAYDIACTGSIACAIESAIDPTGSCH